MADEGIPKHMGAGDCGISFITTIVQCAWLIVEKKQKDHVVAQRRHSSGRNDIQQKILIG
jgi:hypothetical protein